jgi:hypothetical protein
MCVKKTKGNVLIVVLTITALIGFFVHNLTNTIILEYQRLHNKLLEQKLWLQLVFKTNAFIDVLTTEAINIPNDRNIGFVADSLEIGCKTGIQLYSHTVAVNNDYPQLMITYSVRK